MKKSYIIATAFAGIIIAWMASGMLTKQPPSAANVTVQKDAEAPSIIVEVRVQKAKPTVSNITAQGHVEPNREVTLRAETSGQISKIILDEGSTVKEGDVILTLKDNDRSARLAKAKSKTKEETRKYKAAKKLDAKGYTAKTKVDEA
ncbi:MAG: biotin/lipoyl-binding protein [Proteobacteria bacterium]|nr:biotin/lipoyl-binding protein [Pseudomonadota bacterium]